MKQLAKRKTPYDYLMEDFVEFVNRARSPEIHEMWYYPKKDLEREGGWRLKDLWDRIIAAETCGFETILKAEEIGLVVFFRKKVPPRPWRI